MLSGVASVFVIVVRGCVTVTVVVAVVDAVAESDNLILLCLGQNNGYVTLELTLVLSRDEGLIPFAAVEANHPQPQRFKNNVNQ